MAFDTNAGDELGPSTLTFGNALVVLSALTLVLAGEAVESAVESTRKSTDRASTAAEVLLSRHPQLTVELRSWLGDHSVLALLGRGSDRAATEMGSLLLKEAPRFPAESLETAQFRHGPLELAGPETAVAIVATEAVTSEQDLRLAQQLSEDGTAVLVISLEGAGPSLAQRLGTGQVQRMLSPAVSVVPFQLLAGARGYQHCALERASKVTANERGQGPRVAVTIDAKHPEGSPCPPCPSAHLGNSRCAGRSPRWASVPRPSRRIRGLPSSRRHRPGVDRRLSPG
ncbi:MAG TPA: hypothetical protein VMV09_09220 [Candidatus Saccharimonadales bacterium]|nr:hypothetical protein [Candidatus Saccharimonadales bacterium]